MPVSILVRTTPSESLAPRLTEAGFPGPPLLESLPLGWGEFVLVLVPNPIMDVLGVRFTDTVEVLSNGSVLKAGADISTLALIETVGSINVMPAVADPLQIGLTDAVLITRLLPTSDLLTVDLIEIHGRPADEAAVGLSDTASVVVV